MPDSNVANAAKESARAEFPHGLLDFCSPRKSATIIAKSSGHGTGVGAERQFAYSGSAAEGWKGSLSGSWAAVLGVMRPTFPEAYSSVLSGLVVSGFGQ
jgi:hypothetical protein